MTPTPEYYSLFYSSDTSSVNKAIYSEPTCTASSMLYVQAFMQSIVTSQCTPFQYGTLDNNPVKVPKVMYSIVDNTNTNKPSVSFSAGMQSSTFSTSESCSSSSSSSTAPSQYDVSQTNVCFAGNDGKGRKTFCSSDGQLVIQVFADNTCFTTSLINSTRTNATSSCHTEGPYDITSSSCIVSPSATSVQVIMTLTGISWDINSKTFSRDTNALLYASQTATLSTLKATYPALTLDAISVVFLKATTTQATTTTTTTTTSTTTSTTTTTSTSARRLASSQTATVSVSIVTPSSVIPSASEAATVVRQGEADGKFSSAFTQTITTLVQQNQADALVKAVTLQHTEVVSVPTSMPTLAPTPGPSQQWQRIIPSVNVAGAIAGTLVTVCVLCSGLIVYLRYRRNQTKERVLKSWEVTSTPGNATSFMEGPKRGSVMPVGAGYDKRGSTLPVSANPLNSLMSDHDHNQL